MHIIEQVTEVIVAEHKFGSMDNADIIIELVVALERLSQKQQEIEKAEVVVSLLKSEIDTLDTVIKAIIISLTGRCRDSTELLLDDVVDELSGIIDLGQFNKKGRLKKQC